MPAPDLRLDPRLPAAERDAARADLGRFLAACFYEPGPEWREERLPASIVAAAARIDPSLGAIAHRLEDAFESTPLQALLIDHTRLFLGPVQALALPYASVWLGDERVLMQQAAVDVQSLYGEAGFEVAEDFRELPDHVAAELEFLYLLIHRENEARWSGRAEEQAGAAALKARFLTDHLGRWLGPFLQAVRDGAETPFYPALADLAGLFVRREATPAPEPAAPR